MESRKSTLTRRGSRSPSPRPKKSARRRSPSPSPQRSRSSSRSPSPRQPISSRRYRQRFVSCLTGWDVNNLLGKGGNGKVYEVCKDTCEYAVKVAEFKYSRSKDSFEREVRVTKRMSDAKVTPKLYEHQICNGKNGKMYGLIIVEKYNMTLTDYMKTAMLSDQDKVKIQDLVKTMHSEGVAHLDLKSGNIMVKIIGGKPHFAIIDFGYSVIVGEDEPLATIKTKTMIDYYRRLYDDCLTQDNITEIKDNAGDINWDPRFIDDLYLCSMS